MFSVRFTNTKISNIFEILTFLLFVCPDFPAETEPRDAAVPIPAFPAAAAGSVQSGAGAPGPAAAGDGDGAPAQRAADAGSSLLRRTRHAGGSPARPQGNRTESKRTDTCSLGVLCDRRFVYIVCADLEPSNF